MKLPWISRSSHEAMMDLLTAQAADLREERKILLDRLATLGLGGPLFRIEQAVNPESTPESEEIVNPDRELLDELLRLRHRPSKLADELSRHAQRERDKGTTRPKVAWIPQTEKIRTALDEAEDRGKRTVV